MNTLEDIASSYNQICKKLFEKKLIHIKQFEENKPLNNKMAIKNISKTTLNNEQSNICHDIIDNMQNNHKHFILSGIPGSGKTEVYIKIIKNILKQNQTIIVLVPEIALIKQTFDKLNQNFQNIDIPPKL